MKNLKITFENKDVIFTRFNGSIKEAENYYIGHKFDTGNCKFERITNATHVKELKEFKGLLKGDMNVHTGKNI